MVLAQLVIKAISILENSGEIDGIVSDGASTNRKLCVELGISGSMDSCVQNSIIHPLDDSRQIFMFSDAPHLIKNVRNRLCDNGCTK